MGIGAPFTKVRPVRGGHTDPRDIVTLRVAFTSGRDQLFVSVSLAQGPSGMQCSRVCKL